MLRIEILFTVLPKRRCRAALVSALCLIPFIFSSCKQIEQPPVKPFFAESVPPRSQELRWSNGKAPKSIDPAFATAAPETDIIRAIYEGLTEINPKKLTAMTGVAEKWTASDDKQKWTFTLRKDAYWNNGKRVTANDFVATFKRLASFGAKAAHSDLFQNIVGMRIQKPTETPATGDFELLHGSPQIADPSSTPSNFRFQKPVFSPTSADSKAANSPMVEPKVKELPFGVVAVNESVLEISLFEPDSDFAILLSNPIFRPVYNGGEGLERLGLSNQVVSNGAFTIATNDRDNVVLLRSENYWNRANVKLEKVVFVSQDSAESALEAYRNGDVDAVSNANFEPLALKLLTPYKDFRQTIHGALNFYEVNSKVAALSDRRVREALSISIDRERMTDGELEGSMLPATTFLPHGTSRKSALTYDLDRAGQLLASAGYPDGVGFPKLRLVINRNDTQQRVARIVTRMWKRGLNIDVEVIVKDSAELELARSNGDFDLLRRGVVLPTASETVGLTAIFGSKKVEHKPETVSTTNPLKMLIPSINDLNETSTFEDNSRKTGANGEAGKADQQINFSENDALFQLNAIPLYFPTAHLLIKPYVVGFDVNVLDAPLLQQMSIDSNWPMDHDIR